MEIKFEEVEKASKENAERYVERFRNVAQSAFWDGFEWAMSIIKEKMKEA